MTWRIAQIIAFLMVSCVRGFLPHHRPSARTTLVVRHDAVTTVGDATRREVQAAFRAVASATLALATSAQAAHAKPTGTAASPDTIDLVKRVTSNDAAMGVPRGVIQAPDVYYPAYFLGTWNTSSISTGFLAPLGEGDNLFGGKRAVAAAEQDMKAPLVYRSSFSALDDGRVVADRVRNVQSIALASMGPESVVDFTQPDSNVARRLHMGVAPARDVGNIFDIDLIAVSRKFQEPDARTFAVLETSCQLITKRMDVLMARDSAAPPPPLRKVRYTRRG